MSVTWIREKQHDNGCRSRQADIDVKGRKYIRQLVALCTSFDDDTETIYAHTDCPKIGTSTFPTNALARAKTIHIEPLGGGGAGGDDSGESNEYAWIIEVNYDTEAEAEENPLSRAAVVTWERAAYEKPCDRDIEGNPIINSAGQAFDPPVMKDDSRAVLKIVKNFATYDDVLYEPYQDAVSSAPFKGRPRLTWKCAGITGVSKKENSVSFYEVTFEFHYRKETWIKSILDQGRYELGPAGPSDSGPSTIVGAYGPLKPIRDSARNLVSDPVPLNGEGQRAATPNDAAYLPYEVYHYQNLNDLGV